MKHFLCKVFILLGTACIFLTSCSQDSCKVKVLSMDYGITEYSGVLLNEEGITLENVQSDIIFVDEYRGTLVLSSYQREVNAYAVMGRYGYFTGLDLGEFDGWLRFSQYHSDITEKEDTIIAREQCLGFKEVSGGDILTCTRSAEGFTGYVYRLHYVGEDKNGHWEWGKYATIDDYIIDFTCDADENVYVIALSGLWIIDKDGNMEELISGEWWYEITPTSLVILEDIVYIGCDRGFMRYEPDGKLYFFSVEPAFSPYHK